MAAAPDPGVVPAGPALSKLQHYKARVEARYARVPVLGKMPSRASAIIVFLVFINLLVWAAAGIVLVSEITPLWLVLLHLTMISATSISTGMSK